MLKGKYNKEEDDAASQFVINEENLKTRGKVKLYSRKSKVRLID